MIHMRPGMDMAEIGWQGWCTIWQAEELFALKLLVYRGAHEGDDVLGALASVLFVVEDELVLDLFGHLSEIDGE